jgi:outer membrane protein TolC
MVCDIQIQSRSRRAMGAALLVAAVLLGFTADVARAQQQGPGSMAGAASLDSLVARALEANPRIRAARDRVDAARARRGPAGLLPDPMLAVGIQNLPLGRDQTGTATDVASMARRDLPDMMTMRMVAIGQTIPFPGKLGLRQRAAGHQVTSAEAMLTATQREIERAVKEVYYELAFLDRSFEILERNQQVLVNLIRTTESRYTVGVGAQTDVLKARVEAARLAEEAVALEEERGAALARLNALLDRASDMPIDLPRVPERIARAAVADSATRVRFTSAMLGARAADSPVPPLAALQDAAVTNNPELLAHEATIRAQAARVELARKEHLPDFDVSLSYGQRNQRPDMITAMISVPIQWRKGRKQDQYVTEATAELSALEAEHQDRVNALRARVAELHADLERARAQLALFVKAILPQASTLLSSATASFQVGRVDFLTVLDNQSTLYSYETGYFRALSDFATKLAALEAVIGKEMLR